MSTEKVCQIWNNVSTLSAAMVTLHLPDFTKRTVTLSVPQIKGLEYVEIQIQMHDSLPWIFYSPENNKMFKSAVFLCNKNETESKTSWFSIIKTWKRNKTPVWERCLPLKRGGEEKTPHVWCRNYRDFPGGRPPGPHLHGSLQRPWRHWTFWGTSSSLLVQVIIIPGFEHFGQLVISQGAGDRERVRGFASNPPPRPGPGWY